MVPVNQVIAALFSKRRSCQEAIHNDVTAEAPNITDSLRANEPRSEGLSAATGKLNLRFDMSSLNIWKYLFLKIRQMKFRAPRSSWISETFLKMLEIS